ncbi:MAG: FHA domain-containing protein [Planctomycetota bacterium]
MSDDGYELARLSAAARALDAAAFARDYPEPVFWVEASEDEASGELFTRADETLRPGQQVRIAPVRKRDGANLFQRMITIGRAPSNDVVIPGADVSKFHAYVLATPTGPALCDAGSTAGTTLGDTRLEPRERQPLRSGDRARLGSATLVYLEPADLHARLLAAPEPEQDDSGPDGPATRWE